jgi:hypothetical protein
VAGYFCHGEQSVAGTLERLLQPSLALLRHLTGRLHLVTKTTDGDSQLQSFLLTWMSATWVSPLVAPLLGELPSGSNGSSSASTERAAPADLPPGQRGTQVVLLEALTALHQALGQLCKVDAATEPTQVAIGRGGISQAFHPSGRNADVVLLDDLVYDLEKLPWKQVG